MPTARADIGGCQRMLRGRRHQWRFCKTRTRHWAEQLGVTELLNKLWTNAARISEGKGEEDSVTLADTARAQHFGPIPDHPFPRFRRVEPAERPAGGGAGRLVQAVVPLQRVGEDGAVGRVGLLVGDQLGFRGERKSDE